MTDFDLEYLTWQNFYYKSITFPITVASIYINITCDNNTEIFITNTTHHIYYKHYTYCVSFCFEQVKQHVQNFFPLHF